MAAILAAAAAGDFPPADGLVEVLPPDAHGTGAVVAFTGHAFVLADVAGDDLELHLGDAAPAASARR